jgi:hypothetical protein
MHVILTIHKFNINEGLTSVNKDFALSLFNLKSPGQTL